MKKADVKIGESYIMKVSGKIVTVRITSESSYGGWNGVNTKTKREVRIKSAARIRGRLMADVAEKKPTPLRTVDYSKIYPELVGYKCRGSVVPPPQFPDACPKCGAPKTAEDRLALVERCTYACGGGYSPKPQIQNHTDYWWGKCGKV